MINWLYTQCGIFIVLLLLLSACGMAPESGPMEAAAYSSHGVSSPTQAAGQSIGWFSGINIFGSEELPFPTPSPMSPPVNSSDSHHGLQPTLPYRIGFAEPKYMQNFSHMDLGCSWQGISGQVFGSDGTPQNLIIVNTGGTLNGTPVSSSGVTGNNTDYGPGGYEITLGSVPVASSGTLWIQISDLDGNNLSEKTTIDTSADCASNLILVNFYYQGKYQTYFPSVTN